MNAPKIAMLSAALLAMQGSAAATPAPSASVAVAPKTPKAKAGKIVLTDEQKQAARMKANGEKYADAINSGIATLEKVCTPEQLAAVEAFAADAYDHDDVVTSWRAVFRTHVDAIVGNTLRPNRYFAMVGALGGIFGPYVATCFRDAVRRKFGALPTKNDARATGGTKGYSPRKWFRGVESSLAKFAERAARAAEFKADINDAALRGFLDAFAALEKAQSKLGRAINE